MIFLTDGLASQVLLGVAKGLKTPLCSPQQCVGNNESIGEHMFGGPLSNKEEAEQSAWEQYCDDEGVDPYDSEAFEEWRQGQEEIAGERAIGNAEWDALIDRAGGYL